MAPLRAGDFVEIVRISRGDHFYKYRENLIGSTFRVNHIFSKNGPWISLSGVLVLRDVILNGIKIRKGEHLCFHKVMVKSIF